MTWVVGATTRVGYGLLVSDVRVTLAGGGERDCLRKIYQVGRSMAAGFSGSVLIGFDLLQSLSSFLAELDSKRQGTTDPTVVADIWRLRAKSIFDGHDAAVRRAGASIMLVGVASGGWPALSVLRSPEFIPDSVAEPGQLRSIGSGTLMAPALEHLRGTIDLNVAGGLERKVPRAVATVVAAEMTSHLLKSTQKLGVSPFMHVAIVLPNQVEIRTPTGTHRLPDGSRFTVTMPPVATSMRELEEMLNSDAIEAVATMGR